MTFGFTNRLDIQTVVHVVMTRDHDRSELKIQISFNSVLFRMVK